MNKIRFTLKAFAFLAFMFAFATAAQAQATRTWVSGVGDDVNPCSRTAPCKTFAGAISKTAAGGEISVLDPGGYGTVTITKSITIDGGTGAGWGSILACGASAGVIVNDSLTAAPNTIEVILRNLSINGCSNTTSAGLNGVRVLSHKSTTIENVDIFGFSTRGIDIANTVTGNSVFIKDTDIEDIGGAGIFATTTSGSVNVQIQDSTVKRAATGLDVSTGGRVTARNSRFFQSTGDGVRTGGGNTSITFLENCSLDGNTGDGLEMGASTIVRISGNLITLNLGFGINNLGATAHTFSDNKNFGNALGDLSGAALTGQGKS